LNILKREGARPHSELSQCAGRIHLRVTGASGGDFTLILDDEGRCIIEKGTPVSPSSAIVVSAPAMCRVLSGQLDLESAMRDGELAFDGDAVGRKVFAWLVSTFRSLQNQDNRLGAAARSLDRRLSAETA
jgi:hypothetical protein